MRQFALGNNVSNDAFMVSSDLTWDRLQFINSKVEVWEKASKYDMWEEGAAFGPTRARTEMVQQQQTWCRPQIIGQYEYAHEPVWES